jgi:TatD DNase family protein
MLVDTHAHLNMLENPDAAVNSFAPGIIIFPATEPDDFADVLEFTKKYENVYGMLGVHPTEAHKFSTFHFPFSTKIIGIGEIGLDYYHIKETPEQVRHEMINVQKDVFIRLIKLANELNLPINVHDREAHDDVFEILQGVNEGSKVIMHCFSGDLKFAQKCVDAGYYIGIGGVVTFKNAHALKEVAANIPLENIVLETDAPFLAPVPHRGEKNEPAYVKFVAEEIARLKGIPFEEVERVTTQNVQDIFGI